MIRKIVLLSLVLACAAAGGQDTAIAPNADTASVQSGIKAVDASRLDGIEQAFDNALAKAGINFGGEFRSQFLLSSVDGSAVAKSFRKEESVEFTSVDFDVSARPGSELQARLLFRLYQDWRNMWNSFKDPLCSRWISVDGLVKNVFSYHVGDFRRKYSPLTLWSPDIDIEYEPEIFAQQRRYVMGEMFLGNNERLLQGLDLNFDAEIYPLVKEIHVNALGTRLRYVDPSRSGLVASRLDTTKMDKYLAGGNIDVTVIPDLSVGGSFLDIFDAAKTYPGSIDTADILKQNTRIFAGRTNLGTGMFSNTKKFNAAVSAEVAVSSDDSSWNKTDSISPTLKRITLNTEAINGVAASIGLNGTVAVGQSGNVKAGIGYINNGTDFRNELAQSPTFFGVRIMNSENDVATRALYSTFDALYRQVFKFNVSENGAIAGGTAGWLKGPMSKIAYGNGILTQKEMKRVPLDSSLSLVMPLGPATPNRSGIKANASTELLDKAVLASASFYSVSEIDGLPLDSAAVMPQSAFLEVGGGVSCDVASFGRWWRYPLILSGGYKWTSVENSGITSRAGSEFGMDVQFINAGLYWTFVKHASLLGGLQLLTTRGDGMADNVEKTVAQLHWAAGLEYKVTAGGTVTGSFGSTSVSHENESAKDFSQWQTELFLTVNF
jgi:hypothetical protein